MALALTSSPDPNGQMAYSQPDLRVFLTLVISGCGIVVFGRGLVLLGPTDWGWALALVGALTVLFALWCLVAAAAPRLARTVTVLTVCGVMAGSLLSCGILSSREAARRNSALNNLRQLGVGLQEQRSLAPNRGLALMPASNDSTALDRHSFIIPHGPGFPGWNEPPAASQRSDD
jgi:hypothetical protein